MAASALETAVKETKAQRIERIKRAKNPWEALEEIQRFARDGHGSIPKEWLDVYFRWWGTYTQGDGKGVFGKAVPRFMLRIRIPNGLLRSHQLHTIAGLAERYGRGQGDLTVRQNIQLHWVQVEDMPDIISRLSEVGLTTKGSCGDDTRNITGCPLAGLDADEICDASPLVQQATEMLVGNAEFYNLPRKYKISITGCRVWCSYPDINDVGFTAVRRQGDNGQPRVGFSLRVAGGLSTAPHFGVKLNAFVLPEQVPAVLKGVTEIFRDREELRQDRAKARLKFLFLDHGWTAEKFQDELERRLGFALDPAVPEEVPENTYRDHVGIRRQKQPGLYYAGFAILRGRPTAAQMRAVADLADRYGDGQVRTTNMQNIVVVNVPKRHLDALSGEAEAAGLRLEASPFWRGAVACTGTEFCKLAITETKSFARWLVEELEERLPGFDRLLKINVNGCPNSCGQHWISDIGLQGCKMKVDGRRPNQRESAGGSPPAPGAGSVEAFDFLLGGHTGRDGVFSRRVGYRAPAAEVPAAIERLLRWYLEEQQPDERFADFCRRHSDEELRAFLAGEPVEAAPAPAWPGPPPHGVEG